MLSLAASDLGTSYCFSSNVSHRLPVTKSEKGQDHHSQRSFFLSIETIVVVVAVVVRLALLRALFCLYRSLMCLMKHYWSIRRRFF